MAQENAQVYPEYDLSVSFDLKNNLVRGDARIELPGPAEIFLGGVKVTSMSFNGGPFAGKPEKDWIRTSGKGRLEISYEKTVGEGLVANPEREGALVGSVVSEKGISLTGNWYPQLKGLAIYRLSALVPGGFTAISEADNITFANTPGGRLYSFDFPHPVGSIDLVAGDYVQSKAAMGGVDIYTYFFPEDEGLSKRYIEYTKKYLEMDEKLLVPYPYKRFSVVENFLPTGFSMPTFTLLGAEIVRFPFVLDESLGHEITHQWFGNYVYADFSKGNWLEGLTSYVADYRYADMAGKGLAYRKKILVDYQSYVNSGNDFPLRQFFERTGPASMAIGYGKGTMLFYMLEKMVGHDVFYKSLRALIEENRWKTATWADIEKVFEQGSGKRLDWFFSQWLDRKGVPDLKIEDAKFLISNGEPAVSLDVAQEAKKPYRLTLPVSIFKDGRQIVSSSFQIDGPKQKFQTPVSEKPSGLSIDPGYELMRGLSPAEFPPVISRLLGSKQRMAVYSAAQKEKYATLLAALKQNGFTLKDEKDITDKDIRGSSLLVLGVDSPVLKRLFGKVELPAAGFILTVRENPLNTANVVAIAQARSKTEADLAAPKIFHYGQYSTISFSKGVNTGKETAKSRDGIAVTISPPVPAAVPAKGLELDGIINAVSAEPVIFVGERHEAYEDHQVELDVIMALHRMGKKFAIGMEMFQRPFQQSIDDFISKKIGEREFLKKTEYFKRWGFDYDFYRPILEYARANGIPVVALNIRRGIANKVAKGGLDALSADEKKEIPKSMDMSNCKYEKLLRQIFAEHPKGPTFEHFYQAQILWDETMARSAAEYLLKNPGYQMVVLAGEGHIMYGYGIPQRFFRRTGTRYVTLVNGSYDTDIADYVLFPSYEAPPQPAMLGVVLEKTKEGTVKIKEVAPGGPASKAGLVAGDEIVSIDDWKVGSIWDAKIALFDKRPGQTVTVKVLRRRFLFGRTEEAVKVKL
ncbi:MAG: ChaN family lipoprotein [Nitrospiraceae bacterium]|nr:ChaN family lipoprotein [Nitrospiraceae bacterium]